MIETKKRKLTYIVLVITLIIGASYHLPHLFGSTPKTDNEFYNNEDSYVGDDDDSDNKAMAEDISAEKIKRAALPFGRDIFAEPKVKIDANKSAITTPENIPVLEGISSSPEGNSAILSGKLKKSGEEIEGYKIISIVDNKVYLEKNGKVLTLTMGKK